MKNTIIITFLSIFLINHCLSQLSINTKTDKEVYESGEIIILSGTVTNDSDSTITIIGNVQGFFFPRYFNDVELQMTHLLAEIEYEFPPRTSYTSEYIIDPKRLGLPNMDGVDTLISRYSWYTETTSTFIMDTVSISAPAYKGGQVLIDYSINAPVSDIEALRDSMNATVMTSDTLLTLISERWQTSGFVLDSLVTKYKDDPRILNLYADREIFLDSLFVTNVDNSVDYEIDFTLYQNYPNPFNPVTTISYELPTRAFVKLTIYNIIGQIVDTLVNNEQERGRHQIVWDASSLPSGVYYYQLRTKDYVKTKKMLLIQ